MRTTARIRFAVVLAMLGLLALTAVTSAAPGSAVIAKADSQWARRSEPKMADTIIQTLEEASYSGQPDAEILWRLARAYWWKAMRDTPDKASKLELLDKGKAAGEQAAVLDPKNPDAHYWHAACIAQSGQIRGILQSLFMVKPTKEALDKALAADPCHARSHYLMAELLYQVPGPPLSIGNRQKAVEEARLAVKYDPRSSSHQLVLGKTLTATKQYKEAREVLTYVLNMAPDLEDPEGFRLDQEEARAELKAIQGK